MFLLPVLALHILGHKHCHAIFCNMQMTEFTQFAIMTGSDARHQQLFDQSSLTCDAVHVQYGM